MKVTGYFKEYYVENKFIGKRSCEKDRDVIGYAGKQTHIADDVMRFKNKRINKGQSYMTILYPLNGER